MSKVKILLFAANPVDTPTIKLDEEIREIRAKIRNAEFRNEVDLEDVLASRPDDFLQALNEHKPKIVHFCGHGDSQGGIYLIDDENKSRAKLVTPEALKSLFGTFKENVRVVILNACYSHIQAKAISEVIDCVIGMNAEIRDDAAQIFAASFYRGIGFGESIKAAFDQGIAALHMEGIGEENKPKLVTRYGVDPSKIHFFNDKKSQQDELPLGYSADFGKLVELLIGESLYSRDDTSIRELIQNAVDACERKRVYSTEYDPQIIVRVNTHEKWFEVDDNGEGMSSHHLRHSFAIIGKSIQHDDVILNRLQNNTDRSRLIAKFGIGFISVFRIARRVVVSTLFQNEKQINFAIQSPKDNFIYSEFSECGRNPSQTGTTIRIYILDSYSNIDIAESVKWYVRHIPYCKIIVDNKKISLTEIWLADTAIFHRIKKEKNQFELHWGVDNNDEGNFLASNGGFLITEYPEQIMPYEMPSWIIGEVDFFPNVIDLNLARDEIMENHKSRQIKKKLQLYLREFLLDYIQTIQPGTPSGYDPISIARRNILKLFLLYNMISRKRVVDNSYKNIDPPFSLQETNDFILDWLFLDMGDELNELPLREILINLRNCNIYQLFYFDDGKIADPSLYEFMRNQGCFIFRNANYSIGLRGTKGGAFKIEIKDVLGPILSEYGFELISMKNVAPENIQDIVVSLQNLEQSVASILSEIQRQRTDKVTVIDLPNGDAAVYKLRNVCYINISHPIISEALRQYAARSDYEILRAYIRGAMLMDL